MYMVAIAAVVFLALINFLGISSLGLLTSDPGLLPASVQLMWALLCIVAVIWVRFVGVPQRAIFYWSAVFLFVVSVPLFFTRNPCLHGDGNYGAPPVHPPHRPSLVPDMKNWVTSDSHKLKSFLNYGLSKILPNRVLVPYTVGMPESPNPYPTFMRFREVQAPLLNAWRLISMVFGMLTAVVVALAIRSLPANDDMRFGALLLVLASPVLLNAYGHFDNYAIDILLIALWFIAAFRVSRSATPQRLAILGLTLLLVLWNHLFGVFLLFASGLLVGLIWWERRGRRWKSGITVALAGLAGILPLVTRKGGNLVFLSDGYAKQYGRAIYGSALLDQTLLFLRICLPPLLLGGYLLLMRFRRNAPKAGPLQHAALFLVVSASVGMYAMNFVLGIADELNMAVLGAIVLGGIFLLAMWMNVGGREWLYAGVVSLYMFVPCVYVYSDTNLLFEHFRRTIPRSRCAYNLSFSPFVTFGLRCPAETTADQDRMLTIYRDGMSNTLPIWREFNELSRLYYTAWAFEFGRMEEAQKQMLWYFSNNMDGVFDLWHRGTRFTDRHDNLAYRRAREFSRQVLRNASTNGTDTVAVRRLTEILEQFDARDQDPVQVPRS